ncbi:lipoate--protein ligase [Desulfonema ishimotonii]|uniref:lipoate--protein ligase n=1 Tax=Desulfonema ishimotonii TaxID=45657 RepID=A0A401FXA9_9BACT|nr:lipoate--protein ligase [Desulfonema ishimotonii]GBC61586.1 lipoate--protein ligase [Desulfonema ishimotonii]
MFFIQGNSDITDPHINLALEEYCLRHLDMGHPYLLFYINAPSVIIGRNQNTVEEINADYVREKGIRVVRRVSGGGAVYHDSGNLNFSFITRYDRHHLNNFKKFTSPVIRALNRMGVPAALNGRNDIVVSGRKISGNAQYSNGKSMLSHGTLLLDSDLDTVVRALNVSADKIESKGLKSVRSRVANISEFLEKPMSMDAFRGCLLEAVFSPGNGLREYRLTDADWEGVHSLAQEKYRSWDWNYGRSPRFNIRRVRRFEMGQIDARIEVEGGEIRQIRIYGDFLGHGNVADLETRLTGIRYRSDAVRQALEGADLNRYFGKMAPDTFAEFLVAA